MIIRSALAALFTVAAVPTASARDVIYTAIVGKATNIGPWYHVIGGEACKTAALPKVIWIKQPTMGTFKIATRKVEPRQCPGKKIDAIFVEYTASSTGSDQFEFVVEYVSAIDGDWHYKAKTNNVAVPASQ